MNPINEQIERFRQAHSIVVDDLDRIVACVAKNLRERSEIFAQWAALQEQKCHAETTEPTRSPWWA